MRPFRLLGASELAYLRGELQRRAQAWTNEWLREPDCDVDLVALPRAGPWMTVEVDGRRFRWVRGDSVVDRALFGSVAGEQPSACARAAGDAALVDLARRFVDGGAGLRPSEDPPAGHDLRRGACAVGIALNLTCGTIEGLLDGAAVAHLLAGRSRRASRAVLQPLRSAIGSARVSLGASIGEAEVDVATLQTLAVGDVLALDLRIDRPLRLSVCDMPVRRGAYLGTIQGRRALRLTAATDTPANPAREAQS